MGNNGLLSDCKHEQYGPSQGHTDWQVYQKDGVGTYAYDLLAILGNWGPACFLPLIYSRNFPRIDFCP